MKFLKISILTILLFSLVTVSFAQAGAATSPGQSLTIQRVYGILIGFACWLSQIALVVMVIAIALYGLMFMWAQGNPQAFSQAKTSFGWGIVGSLVIYSTYIIIISVYAFIADPSATGSVNATAIVAPFTGCAQFQLP